MKATLPKLMPMNRDTVSNTVKETAKSLVSSESQYKLDAEKELVQTKEDAIIRHTTFCAFDSNERLGNLIKFYGPPGQSPA